MGWCFWTTQRREGDPNASMHHFHLPGLVQCDQLLQCRYAGRQVKEQLSPLLASSVLTACETWLSGLQESTFATEPSYQTADDQLLMVHSFLTS